MYIKFRKMSPTDGDETSRGRNPENGRRRDFGRRRRRQSGFQHTDRPRPSSPELLNKYHNAGRESLISVSAALTRVASLENEVLSLLRKLTQAIASLQCKGRQSD